MRQPDVTKHNDFYRLEVEDQIFDLRLENVSEPLTSMDEENERKIYTEFFKKWGSLWSIKNLKWLLIHDEIGRKAELSRKEIDELTFERASDPFSLHVFAYGEIVSATGFQCSPIYIKYHIEMPDGWYERGAADATAGCTQAASFIYDSTMGRYTFQIGHPFELSAISQDTSMISKFSGSLFI
jgi:hypothetical protein